METTTIIRGARSGAIDWLRAAAVLSVAVYHFLMVAPTHSLLGRFVGGSWLGVDLFFVLSGYLVWRSFEASGFDKRAFYRRRAWRILPVYLVMLGLCGAMAWTLPDVNGLRQAFAQALPYYLTLTHNFSAAQPIPNAWSIAVEEQFYILLPLIAPLLLGLRRRTSFRSALGLGLVGVALVRVAQVWLHPEVVGPELHTPAAMFGRWVYAPTHCRLDGLWVGLLLGMYQGTLAQHLQDKSLRRKIFGTGMILLAGLWWLLGPYRTWSPRPFVLVVFGFTGTALACGLLVASAQGSRFTAPRVIRWLSDRIYSLYVVQAPLLMVFGGVGMAVSRKGFGLQLGLFGAFLGLILLFGDWLFRFVEAPLAKLGSGAKVGLADSRAVRPDLAPADL